MLKLYEFLSKNPEHRVLMFSATFHPRVKKIAEELLHDDFILVGAGRVNVPVETVAQEFIQVVEKWLKSEDGSQT
jgi:superfamily II DNA/RNA helicase